MVNISCCIDFYVGVYIQTPNQFRDVYIGNILLYSHLQNNIDILYCYCDINHTTFSTNWTSKCMSFKSAVSLESLCDHEYRLDFLAAQIEALGLYSVIFISLWLFFSTEKLSTILYEMNHRDYLLQSYSSQKTSVN